MEQRKEAHFQGKEPLFENLLRKLRLRRIKKHVPTDAVVLDIGCGFTSFLLENLSDQIKKGYGVDLEVGESKNEKVKLIKHDLNADLPFKANEFDAVVSLANLEHLEKPQISLNESYRVLKEGGVLLLTTPSKKSKPVLEFLAFKLGVVSKSEIADHKQYFDVNSLQQSLKIAGFETNKTKVTTFQMGMNLFVVAYK